MHLAQQIKRIEQKLTQLEQFDKEKLLFGASFHQYKRKKVYQQELDHFEITNPGVKLPEDYKQLLLTIGTQVGPDYGLLSLGEIRSEYKEWVADFDGNCSMNAPCELTDQIAWDIIQHRKTNPTAETAHYLKSVSGMLPLDHEEDTFTTIMVLNGEQTGKIWYLDRSGYKTIPSGITFELTFIEWYERWLDRHLPQGERPTEY